MADGSMKQDPFKDTPKNQVFRKLTIEVLKELELKKTERTIYIQLLF